MPVSASLKSPFIPDNHYHLVLKSIGGLSLFNSDMDYSIFLERFLQFTSLVFDTWAYCQLNNHVHFIVKTKPLDAVLKNVSTTDSGKQTIAMKKLMVAPDNEEIFDQMIERQLNSFMVSYANYIKNKYHHHGGLFQKPFKRIQIDSDAYLQMAIIYVHANPVKHKMFSNYKIYGHSSYASILKRNSFYGNADAVLEFYGGPGKFVLVHDEQINYYYQKGFPNSKLE